MVTEIPSRRRKGTSSGEKDKDGQAAATNAPFDDGIDFIPFGTDSDAEKAEKKEDRERSFRRKGKERDASSPSPPPLPSQSRDSDSWDKRGERENGHTREWDRGKRKRDRDFDPNDGYQNKKQRADANSRLAPWVDDMDWEGCENAAELFHREVLAFVNWISPTPQEDEIRGLVVQIISRAITASFPDAQVCPFGSYATKLYLPSGDIDLVIRSRSMAYANTQTLLTALASTIKRSQITNKVTIIAKARVPIVKFVTNHEYGRFSVDLSINQDNGIVAGEIISGFLKEFGGGSKNCLALRALVLLTKLFLSQRNMNEVYTGGLGSYAIVCLVISFLQMHPKIRHGQIDPDANLGVLVMEFFELYGRRFRYEEVGISLREGGSYFGKRQRGWGGADQWGRRYSMLSIEDPGDPTNDISSGSYNFPAVRRNIAGAHDVLTSTIYMRAGILEARKDRKAFRLRDRYEPCDTSILSSVLGVTQETLNNRRLAKEVYDKQTLHRRLGVSPAIYTAPTVVEPSTNGINGVNWTTKPKSKSKSSKSDAKASSLPSSRLRTPMVVIDDAAEGSCGKPNGSGVRAEDHWAEADAEEHVATREMVAEDDDGRYSIGSGPPKKRRRTGKHSADAHVVTYITDSESEEGEVRPGSVKGKGKEKDKGKEKMDAERAPEKDKPDVARTRENGRGGAEVQGDIEMLHIKGVGSRSSSKDEDKASAERVLDAGVLEMPETKGAGSRPSSRGSLLKPSSKRDYWLSKGIGLGQESSP